MRQLLLVLCLLIAAPAVSAAEAEVPPRYTLKRESRVLGFDSGSPGNAQAQIPFDKPYDQLSAEQKAILKRPYEAMADGDEPPFPIEGLRTLYAPITNFFQRLLISGTFYAEVVVGTDGMPVSISVFQSPDPQITRLVSGVVLLSKFRPASCQGSPCAMAFPVRIGFKVE